jgi:N6-L-threonylcarbamoyladenine synthase
MIFLGIESSCDETSVAIISNNILLVNLVASQQFHSNYGGVIPELSSRAHLQIILPLFKQALQKSNISLNQIDVISATAGPGLIGALLVGLSFAKGLSLSLNKPFVPVNHIEGHIFSGFLMDDKPTFPMLNLVVSGGHTLLLLVKSETEIYKLGTTIDDAAGEAFDKVGKMLNLEYPGGPKIQFLANSSSKTELTFPIAKTKNEFDFSFSGLKTSVLRHIQKNFPNHIPDDKKAGIAFAFQEAVTNALISKCEKAIKQFKVNSISIVGGVAANQRIKESFIKLGKIYDKKVVIPSPEFCGDNAAMIALRGKQLFEQGFRFSLSENAFPSIHSNHFLQVTYEK